MARRRKKAKQKQPASGTNGTAPVVLDKSLPALPPSAVPQNALQQVETPGSEAEIETPTEASPRSEAVKRFTPDPMVNIRRDVSPIGTDDKKGQSTNLSREQIVSLTTCQITSLCHLADMVKSSVPVYLRWPTMNTKKMSAEAFCPWHLTQILHQLQGFLQSLVDE